MTRNELTLASCSVTSSVTPAAKCASSAAPRFSKGNTATPRAWDAADEATERPAAFQYHQPPATAAVDSAARAIASRGTQRRVTNVLAAGTPAEPLMASSAKRMSAAL